MFESYRAWLESELRLLGNASHHAYAIGQANMAKRAIERFDEALHEAAAGETGAVTIALGLGEARAALDALAAADGASPTLAALRSRLAEGLGRAESAAADPVRGATAIPLDPSAVAERPPRT